MARKLARLHESASQTAGPYVHIGLTPNFAGIRGVYPEDIGAPKKPVSKSAITVTGRIYDGQGNVVRDCLLEFSQVDERGSNSGFIRIPVDLKDGSFRFQCEKPTTSPGPNGTLQAPHLTVWIVARGINIGLHTRLYFADEETANKADPILAVVPKSRRTTLMAGAIGKQRYQFDIRLQGDGETVFFDA